MNFWHTAAGDVRSKGKCYSISGSLHFMLLLLLLVAQVVNSRPADESDEVSLTGGNDEYTDVDNVEFHHVKIVDGVMREDHPIVMYKEDFVTEDYDPSKNKSSKNTTSHRPQRKYKDINRHRRLNTTNVDEHIMPPEKIYFDILPETPIAVTDDDSDFDLSRIRAELVPLVDNHDKIPTVLPDKDELNKRPKKYHSRQRRQTNTEHNVRKRNPYYPQNSNQNRLQAKNLFYPQPIATYPQSNYAYLQTPVGGLQRHAVQGKQPNLFSIESRFVIWDRKTTRKPEEKTPPPDDTWHDSNPNNVDFSQYETTKRPGTDAPNRFPQQRPTPRPQSRPTTTPIPVTTSAPEQTGAKISQCIWAIVNCCSSNDRRIRYDCFEEFGCVGAFWGINPCADTVRANAINHLDNFYN